MADFFPEHRKEGIRMSHLIPRAPNAQAIQSLGESLANAPAHRRRERSLRTCHRPAHREPSQAYQHVSGAYVPQFSARLLNDPRLSDGARRCAIKLMELAYRRDREGRSFRGTVLYLAKCLGRSERAVQAYLAQLRAGGYIGHEVIRSERARMCVGILITLLEPLFPRHHRKTWPTSARSAVVSGVKKDSENYRSNIQKRRFQDRVSVEHWARLCMDGVFRALMKTQTPQGSFV